MNTDPTPQVCSEYKYSNEHSMFSKRPGSQKAVRYTPLPLSFSTCRRKIVYK